MPSLSTLYLSKSFMNLENNTICCINELKKVDWPSIETIHFGKPFHNLAGNHINEGNPLTYLASHKKLCIPVEEEGENEQTPDNRWIMKMQPRLKTVNFACSRRIRSKPLERVFKRKYKNSKMEVYLPVEERPEG